jgi:hypothetical protein
MHKGKEVWQGLFKENPFDEYFEGYPCKQYLR